MPRAYLSTLGYWLAWTLLTALFHLSPPGIVTAIEEQRVMRDPGPAAPCKPQVDSILIDEARTPLIISGPTQDEVKWYGEFAAIARSMVKDVDYEVDEKKRTISVLEPGITKVEDYLGIDNLYDSVNTPLISFMNNAIKAKELFRNDKEYVVMNGEVLIVDEHTGRMLPGRRYNEGMHQAFEAKEGLVVTDPNETIARISFQRYFRLYYRLAGMTGTAREAAGEFGRFLPLAVEAFGMPEVQCIRDRSQYPPWKNVSEAFIRSLDVIEEAYAFSDWWFAGLTAMDAFFPFKKKGLALVLLRRLLRPLKRMFYRYDLLED